LEKSPFSARYEDGKLYYEGEWYVRQLDCCLSNKLLLVLFIYLFIYFIYNLLLNQVVVRHNTGTHVHS